MTDPMRLAETVRAACLQAALDAFEDAGISGLCMEGRWELAVQAIRTLDLGPLVAQSQGDAPGAPSPASRAAGDPDA